MVGTADSVLMREVSFIQGVPYRVVHYTPDYLACTLVIPETPQAANLLIVRLYHCLVTFGHECPCAV